VSVEEFLNWDSGDALKYELVDGEPRVMAPANRTHGILQGRLATLINNHLDREQRPCSLIVGPGVVPRLLPDHNHPNRNFRRHNDVVSIPRIVPQNISCR
jgi:Uma2 family endonuclease